MKVSSSDQYVHSYLLQGVGFLEDHHVPEPEISAGLLLGQILKKTRVKFYSEAEKNVSEFEKKLYFVLLKKRAERYPLQYLLGNAAFRDVSLHVGEGCLIPRPETELLVEAVLKRLNAKKALHLLDIGTGSGNIAVSLAVERPDWRVMATDISSDALRFAQINAEANQADKRIQFVNCDLYPLGQKFDCLVSNPPYLSSQDFLNLQKEVAFEPRIALDGGEDGLLFYRRIIRSADQVLKPGGMIFFEVGMGQAQAISAELHASGFESIEISKDYSGIDRIVSAKTSLRA